MISSLLLKPLNDPSEAYIICILCRLCNLHFRSTICNNQQFKCGAAFLLKSLLLPQCYPFTLPSTLLNLPVCIQWPCHFSVLLFGKTLPQTENELACALFSKSFDFDKGSQFKPEKPPQNQSEDGVSTYFSPCVVSAFDNVCYQPNVIEVIRILYVVLKTLTLIVPDSMFSFSEQSRPRSGKFVGTCPRQEKMTFHTKTERKANDLRCSGLFTRDNHFCISVTY